MRSNHLDEAVQATEMAAAVESLSTLIHIMSKLATKHHGGLPWSEIELIEHRLARLDHHKTARFENAAPWLRQPLQAIVKQFEGDAFTRVMRRDLRTCLRALTCIIDTLEDDSSASHLTDEQLNVTYRRFDIASLIKQLTSDFTPLALERQVIVDVEAPQEAWIEADASLLEKVLLNLFFNAFKHTPTGGRIECRIALKADGDDIAVSIEDSGPGIAPVHTNSIFQRSGYIDRSAVFFCEDIGFSLATSRDILALHGGTLTLDQNHSKQHDTGAIFHLQLPRTAPTGSLVSSDPAPQDGLALWVSQIASEELCIEHKLGDDPEVRDERPLILIVEDNRAISRVLVDELQNDYSLALAFDGVVGLQKAFDLTPDLIITDLTLPRLDGASMIAAILERPRIATTPIVVLTTRTDPASELKLLEAGVLDIIHKPFLAAEVKARVRNIVVNRRAHNVLSALTKKQESDLVQLAQDVACQQHELEAALEQVRAARAMAESANMVKSNFLRMMSHELKTPLTAMQLHMGIMERDKTLHESERLRDGLSHIHRGAKRLLSLIDTMLEWVRVESGRCQLNIGPCNLETAVANALEDVERQVRTKNLVVASHFHHGDKLDTSTIHTDERLLQIVLSALVARAVSVTPQGAIDIQISSAKHTNRIEITDGSELLTSDEQAELFAPFQNPSDLRWRKGSGSGLGLFVIRDLSRAIGGELEATISAEGRNVLSLTLPDEPKRTSKSTFDIPITQTTSPTAEEVPVV